MPKSIQPARGRAFALVDLLVLLALLAGVVALLSVLGPRSRRLAQAGESLANLKQHAQGTQSYGADYAERVWSFSWRPNNIPADADADLRASAMTSDLTAAAAQAVQILRRRGGRTDFPVIDGWIPHVLYSHLVLAEHMNAELPLRFAVSPADRSRLSWSNTPRGPFNPPLPSDSPRWAYSSSYELGPSFYSPDSGDTLSSGGSTNTYLGPTATNVLGLRTLAQVAHPSRKAMVWERYARYSGPRAVYCLYPEARVPMLFADGSVALRVSNAGNRGWDPRNPASPFPIQMTHTVESWEGGTAGPIGSVTGYFRWTRGGLAGRDFDGAEVMP